MRIHANMGSSTLLITMNLQNIAQMSCNPAMGGIAKGQIVKEIDALVPLFLFLEFQLVAIFTQIQ